MSNQRTHLLFGALVVATAVLLAGYWLFARLPASSSNVRAVEDHSVFYRLVTKYRHGDEIINFDIVVGCAVRVTRWGDGDKSYDAFRDPAVYVKATQDGGALLQIVPDACRGETTENGEVPDDFLPGAVWFDHVDNLSLGIAYVTEDAFESPLSTLKFLGASIYPATRSDYVAFEPMAAENLMDPRPLFTIRPIPDLEEVKKHFGNSRALTKIWPGMDCNAVKRSHLTDPAQRAIVREYWPESRPRYWMPSVRELEELNDRIHLNNEMIADNRPVKAYSDLNDNVGNGFPTRSQGGLLRSKHRAWNKLPPTVFPIRRDEGIPWIKEDYLTMTILNRDIDIADGAYQGFAYCYAQIGGGGSLQVPAYLTGAFHTRVDEEQIFGEATDDRNSRERPWPFFERDEYYYVQDTFGLN